MSWPISAMRRVEMLDIALGIADLPTHGMLIVDMGGAKPFEPGDIGFKPRLLHQPLVAGSDGLGHGELVGLAFADDLRACGSRCRRRARPR